MVGRSSTNILMEDCYKAWTAMATAKILGTAGKNIL